MKRSIDSKTMNDAEAVVAIGGIGGSGTRVVAQIISLLGYHIGNQLNKESDNLLFTLLFKNPGWFIKANSGQFRKRFRVFRKIMTGKRLGINEMRILLAAALTNKTEPASLRTAFEALTENLLQTMKKTNSRWGWKEPNTHIYLDWIAETEQHFKYIHVIRHGLDMAFSHNKQQVNNWGFLFGIGKPEHDNEDLLILNQLDYWIKANKKVIGFCREKLGKKFYLLNYNTLLNNPTTEMGKLAQFLEVDTLGVNGLTDLVKKPVTDGRYRTVDLSVFRQEQLDEVMKLGFEI